MITASTDGHAHVRGETLSRISTGLVQLHSRYYGKGPTKSKTHIVDDLVVCILQGGFTTVERTLIETGGPESVYQMRRSFQLAMEEEFKQVVEEATARRVIAYMSSIHIDPELAVEMFVLEPLPEVEELLLPAPGPTATDTILRVDKPLKLAVGPGAVGVAPTTAGGSWREAASGSRSLTPTR